MEAAQAIPTGVVALVVFVPAIVICFLKGKPILGIIGIFVGLVALVGAIRLAKPDSRWARQRYDRTYLALAQARFPKRVDDEDRVTKIQLEEDLNGWTSKPPHATEVVDVLDDRLAVPGRWVVTETPNDVIYRKPAVPHVAMLIVFLLLLPLAPVVLAIWAYLAYFANEQRHRLTFTEGTGVTEEQLDRAEHSYPVGLRRTAWREAPEAESAAA